MSTWTALELLCALAVMLQGSADYPAKPVWRIEPFGAGGGPDLIARAISPKLTELWGQQVTVENHPGAGSTAAPALVAKSPADGYTLLVNTSAQLYSAAVLKNLPYDPLNDFSPVAPAGIGTGTHFGAEKFNLEAGSKAVHVPGDTWLKRSPIQSQRVPVTSITPISYAEADIRAGRLRALGVTTKRRSPLLPEVPTITEVGVAEFD